MEDQAIRALVSKEIKAGLKNVTDGEFRRAYWHLDFFWGFQGIEHHPFVEHFKFLRDLVADQDGVEAKYTIPAPAQFYFELIRDAEHVEKLNQVYPDFNQLREDIKKAYLQVVEDLYDAGLRTLQVDDCTWGVLVDVTTILPGLLQVDTVQLLKNYLKKKR